MNKNLIYFRPKLYQLFKKSFKIISELAAAIARDSF
jgi:hypothetical protein